MNLNLLTTASFPILNHFKSDVHEVLFPFDGLKVAVADIDNFSNKNRSRFLESLPLAGYLRLTGITSGYSQDNHTKRKKRFFHLLILLHILLLLTN